MGKVERERRWRARSAERRRLASLSDQELVARIAARAQSGAELGHRDRLVAAALELSHPTVANRPREASAA